MTVVNFKIPVSEKPAESTELKTFTSHKMDLINALVADHTILPSDKLVAICIVQCIGDKTGHGYPSDETIADKTALSVETVKRARKNLRAAGWLTWKRRFRTSSLYWVLAEPMAAVAERQQVLALSRKDRREAEHPAYSEPPQAAHLGMSKVSPMTLLNVSELVPEAPKVSPMTLRVCPERSCGIA
jgi:Helix-turn-helix domain